MPCVFIGIVTGEGELTEEASSVRGTDLGIGQDGEGYRGRKNSELS